MQMYLAEDKYKSLNINMYVVEFCNERPTIVLYHLSCEAKSCETDNNRSLLLKKLEGNGCENKEKRRWRPRCKVMFVRW